MSEEIKNNLNAMFDDAIAQMANDDQISLEEFEMKLSAIERARSNAIDVIGLFGSFFEDFL
jgi:hypothetical protein